jgi:uncharacterized membrane protein YeiH
MPVNDILFQVATAIFAITGVLAAAKQNMDVMSFIIIGVVTAIGGGTLRDITLNAPVFWLQDPRFLYVATGAALATFFLEQRFRATFRLFLYLDAIATAVFAVMAAEKSLALGFGHGVAVVMGVITGIGGGVIRDLLTGQATLLSRRELFMTPILVGLIPYVAALDNAHPHSEILAPLAMLLIATLRFGAIRLGWGFPDWLTYKPLK